MQPTAIRPATAKLPRVGFVRSGAKTGRRNYAALSALQRPSLLCAPPHAVLRSTLSGPSALDDKRQVYAGTRCEAKWVTCESVGFNDELGQDSGIEPPVLFAPESRHLDTPLKSYHNLTTDTQKDREHNNPNLPGCSIIRTNPAPQFYQEARCRVPECVSTRVPRYSVPSLIHQPAYSWSSALAGKSQTSPRDQRDIASMPPPFNSPGICSKSESYFTCCELCQVPIGS